MSDFKYIITIGREYGAGGRTVAKRLSELLDIPYYDKDIMRLASDASGIFQGLFGRVDEYSSSRPSLFAGSEIYKGELIGPDKKDFMSDQNLFNYQAKVIHELAEKEDCVIVGRCSNYVLSDLFTGIFSEAPDCFRHIRQTGCFAVFIHEDVFTVL